MSAVPAAPPTGDAASGERLFRVNCSTCHAVNGRGGQLGPDLSRIGSARPRAGLLNKLRGASEVIRAGYEPVTLVTREGERIRGVKKNEDEFSIQIMDTRERLQGFLKANLSELTIEKQLLMSTAPSGSTTATWTTFCVISAVSAARTRYVDSRPERIRPCAR